MELAGAAGLKANVFAAIWRPGADAAHDLPPFRRAVDAADDAGIEPILAVWQLGPDTPLDQASRDAFAEYAVALVRALPSVRTVIVGNEPNLNLFWMPQFDASGGDAAAVAYEQLLAETYDRLKAADPDITVLGGALSSHGSDRPASSRPTHSPTEFIRDLGSAYRASARTRPLMDEFAMHVYGESPREPPSVSHPRSTSIGIADYSKLVSLVDDAFGGHLPIAYTEYGVETTIPRTHASAYEGREVVDAVDEKTQAAYYREAIRLAACEPRVDMLLFFHVIDETQLTGLQSGFYYADDAPKASVRAVRDTAVTCRS